MQPWIAPISCTGRYESFGWVTGTQSERVWSTIKFSEVCLENRDYALAIRREFRSWARAIEEAVPPSGSGED